MGSFATARDFYGRAVQRGGPSVYVAADDPARFKVRVSVWKRAHRLPLDETVGLYTFPECARIGLRCLYRADRRCTDFCERSDVAVQSANRNLALSRRHRPGAIRKRRQAGPKATPRERTGSRMSYSLAPFGPHKV
jgi:hypothetical protein